jgi:hypothetical protein
MLSVDQVSAEQNHQISAASQDEGFLLLLEILNCFIEIVGLKVCKPTYH